MRNRMLVAGICLAVLAGGQAVWAAGQRGGGPGSGRKQKNKPTWTPSAWQKELPAIVITEKGREKTYSFQSLIRADGYLCPGSAWSYQTLRIALPLLFKEETPEKSDIQILYGESKCATRVFKYFMGNPYSGPASVTCDPDMPGRQQAILRKSTGVKVVVTYAPPAADGHTPQGAQAGDAALRARDGDGLQVETVTPEEG